MVEGSGFRVEGCEGLGLMKGLGIREWKRKWKARDYRGL